ncbi:MULTISPECIES: WXG100 family type VII secretion target [unclassified Rhodococcus (in: high G+C Gram-positive bacteria)]|uniref:WXG100 family type VII secretion target n=1 Tax=unclassified Rhodococcus (in: high G+C Gram-positive bacteria) TaxID=192944 RepID=UPI0015C61C7F|nr:MULTISPECIES: WXG100 family type VII secretion target [unclassified Rhodococcus (in: high G+C Gram-positive bacteria)]
MAGFVPHDPVKADPDRIRRASARMSGLAAVLWDDIDLVRLAAEELLETSWTGAAADSHTVLWAEWVDSARKICGALTEDAWLLDGIATEYAASDNVIDEHVVDSGLRLDR